MIKSDETSWVYARRDAIRALTNIYKLLKNNDITNLGVTPAMIMSTFECFLTSLSDYTFDSKGDSGCHVREAGLEAIDSLFELCTNHLHVNELCTNADMQTRLFAGVIQQAVERIDRTRAIASRVFVHLLYNPYLSPSLNFIPRLMQLFPQETCGSIDWNCDHVTLPLFVHLLRQKEFQDSILVGFIYSIGSLTESLRKAATNSFLRELKAIEKENLNELRVIMEKILILCRSNLKGDRLSSSLIRSVDLIIQDGLLKNLNEFPVLFLNVFLENVNTTKVINIFRNL